MMSRFNLLLAMWLSGVSLVQAGEEKPAPVTVPNSVNVPVGGIGYLAVKVDRKQLTNQVQIKLQNLPEGVVVASGETSRKLENETQSAVTFILQASTSAAVDLTRKIDVVVISGDSRFSQSVNVNVVQFAMRPLSWLVLSLSVTSVLTLVTFCVWRVLTLPPVEKDTITGPLEIDTRDTQDTD